MAGLRARVVIDDCRVAIETLDECEFGPEWRRSWVTVVALPRAVGHVLQKVDARTDARMAEVIRQQYESLKRSKPEPAIYWAFIEGERNNVLKEYQFSGRHASSTTSASSMSLAVGDGQIVTVTRAPRANCICTSSTKARSSADTKWPSPKRRLRGGSLIWLKSKHACVNDAAT